MGNGTVVAVASAATSTWNSLTRRGAPLALTPEEIAVKRPLLQVETTTHPSSSTGSSLYGTTSLSSSPERMRGEGSLGRVPEEDVLNLGDDGWDEDDQEEEEEWELEQQGLYIGTYKRTIALYTFVPLTSLLLFIFLAFLPTVAWSIPRPITPHPLYFASPLPELLASISFWSFSHLLRLPTFTTFSALFSSPTPILLLSTTVHVIIHNLLRLSLFPILSIREKMEYPLPTWRDWAFRRVWWIALGWCAAENVVGIVQTYEQIGWYKDVMVEEKDVEDVVNAIQGKRFTGVVGDEGQGEEATPTLRVDTGKDVAMNGNGNRNGKFVPADISIQMQVERDLNELIALKEREELEEVYGVPVISIPVFVSCLQRVSSIILSIGLTLLVSSAYLRCPISLSTSPAPIFNPPPPPPMYPPSSYTILTTTSTTITTIMSSATNAPFNVTFPLVLLIHLVLSFLHTPLVLPRIGVHTAAYVGILVGLGCFFSGLAMWDALS